MSPSRSAEVAHLLLRVGVAFAFLYPPIMAVGDPVSWMSYFPSFVRDLPINTTLLLHAFGVVEVAIALWLLSGVRIRIPAALAALMLVAIVIANPSDFEVLFRDLTIAAAALALFFWPRASAQPSLLP